MANELFFDRANNVVNIKSEQSIEDFEQDRLCQLHMQNLARRVYLVDQLEKIKSGVMKFGSALTQENIDALVRHYENELEKLKS